MLLTENRMFSSSGNATPTNPPELPNLIELSELCLNM